MNDRAAAQAASQQTIESYEAFADDYNGLVDPLPPLHVEVALAAVAAAAGRGGWVLEIGSGPGRDADFLETLGVTVRRTDATKRFLELQAARGKTGDLLNVITDELGGPYDAVVALCVLIHVPRDRIGDVLTKIASALRPGGIFLVSMRDGEGETHGKYHTVYWRRDAFAARIKAAGLDVMWDEYSIDSDSDAWTTFFALRPA